MIRLKTDEQDITGRQETDNNERGGLVILRDMPVEFFAVNSNERTFASAVPMTSIS